MRESVYGVAAAADATRRIAVVVVVVDCDGKKSKAISIMQMIQNEGGFMCACARDVVGWRW